MILISFFPNLLFLLFIFVSCILFIKHFRVLILKNQNTFSHLVKFINRIKFFEYILLLLQVIQQHKNFLGFLWLMSLVISLQMIKFILKIIYFARFFCFFFIFWISRAFCSIQDFALIILLNFRKIWCFSLDEFYFFQKLRCDSFSKSIHSVLDYFTKYCQILFIFSWRISFLQFSDWLIVHIGFSLKVSRWFLLSFPIVSLIISTFNYLLNLLDSQTFLNIFPIFHF
jgi:hypothetical protein